MSKLQKQVLLEQFIYWILWLVIFLIPFAGGYFAANNGVGKPMMWLIVCSSWLATLPFFVLFLLNNYLLVPRFLFAKKYSAYILFLLLAVTAFAVLFPPGYYPPKELFELNYAKHVSGQSFLEQNAERYQGLGRRIHVRKPMPFPGMMLPFVGQFIIAVLMVGFNIAVKLFFKSLRDEVTMRELEHQHLQSELRYLKYQINPHFFMNTLNNIHALVDIDSFKAQKAIVELSKLMRYVLYETGNKTTRLSGEMQFLENYIELMKLRYTSKVVIELTMFDEVPEVKIPPLLFISFVENAFKHGVSYQKESFVRVVLEIIDSRLSFRCSNSNWGKSDAQHSGIGLENIRKRLRLLFGNDYTLSIKETVTSFDVLLIIPLL